MILIKMMNGLLSVQTYHYDVYKSKEMLLVCWDDDASNGHMMCYENEWAPASCTRSYTSNTQCGATLTNAATAANDI